MKTYQIIFLLFITISFTNYTFEKAHPQLRHDVISFHYMSPLSKTDFRNPGEISLLKTSTQLTATTAIFVDHVGFQGTSSSTAAGANTALFIASDNVVIDLGGKTLYQNSANTGTNGIEINANQKNITIKNGSIVGFKGAGIYIRPGCDNIRLQHVVISNCGKQGIYFAGTNAPGNEINNCIIEDCMISKTTGTTTVTQAVGLQLDYCNNIFINHCIFGQSDGSALNKDGIGALIQNSNNIIFDHCDASSNKGLEGYGFKIIGTDTGSSACSFSHCTAHNNTGTNSAIGGNGYGFYSQTVNSFIWDSCNAFGNNGTKNGYGFYIHTGKFISILSCESNGNKAGIFATTTADGGKGFYFSNGTGNTFLSSIATGNQGNSSNANNMSLGIDLQNESYPIINGCQIRSNGSDNSLAWSIGIQLNNCTQAIIKKSRIFNNRSNTALQAYGIRDTAINSSSLIINSFFFGNGQGTTISNFSINYSNQGELNTTAPVSVGGMSGISVVKPFQNITVIS